jgi:hypothetical protein
LTAVQIDATSPDRLVASPHHEKEPVELEGIEPSADGVKGPGPHLGSPKRFQ